MEAMQSFRLTGTMEVKKVPIQYVDGLKVVCWESIEQVFPGVSSVKNGNVVVPHFIKHSPDVVLDIVLSSAMEHLPADSSAGALNAALNVTSTSALAISQTNAPVPPLSDNFVEGLRITSALTKTPVNDILACTSSNGPSISSLPQANAITKTALTFMQVVKLASKKAKESNGLAQQKEISEKMDNLIKSQEEMKQLQMASDAKQEEMNRLQKQLLDHQEEMKQLQKASDAKQEEMKQLALDHHEETRQLQIQALGQLAVLQTRVQAVLTQTYELHEYPIPRLFVVLPQNPSRWDAANPFSNKFQLYFLCECGEHTKSIDSKSEIHFAKHKGYEITRPTEFFQLYGSHVLTVLKMLKYGISAAGVVVPAISHMVHTDAIDQASDYLKNLKGSVDGMDHVINWMDKVSENEGESVDELSEQMENKEALEGTDLRKLDTFLNTKDGNKVLGNLYRTVTDEGHVKWVCIDHYRENYQEYTAKDFQRMLGSVGGTFDKNIGRVEVKLQSKVLAEQFSSALGKARSVYDLDITFNWACTTSDLEVLEGALKISTRVSILRLDLQYFQPSLSSKLLSASAQFGIFFRFQGLPNMKTVHIVLPKEFIKHLSFQPKPPSHLCKSSFELIVGKILGRELGILSEALKINSILTTLDLAGNSIRENGAQVLAEALKTNSTLTTLNLVKNSIGDAGAQELANALKTNSTLTTLSLEFNSIGNTGAQALSYALKTNSALTNLNLEVNSIGDTGAQALAIALKINSILTTLSLVRNSIGDTGAQTLSEALKMNSTLTTLSLYNNNIGLEGALALILACKINATLTTLDLNCNLIGDHTVQVLSEAFKKYSDMTTLDLESNSIRDTGALALSEALKTNSTLTILRLSFNSIRCAGVQALSEVLKTNSTLTTLHLNANLIKDTGAQALSEALKMNSTLTTLGLGSNSIEDTGAQALSEALKTNSTLTTLHLYLNSIRGNGAQALSEALKRNSTLTTLSLYNNEIGDYGAQALSEALKTNLTLTTLNLYSNWIGDTGARALANALKTNSTLTTLNLEANSIGDTGAQALANALRTNSSLTTLNLEANSIGDTGAHALKAIKTNLALTIYS